MAGPVSWKNSANPQKEFEMPSLKATLSGAAMALALIATQGPAGAEVVDQQANGFVLQEKEQVAATPEKIYAALIEPSTWWNRAHTFSGDPRNMTLDARAGGCWCEKLPKSGGSVLHMTVINADPGRLLRMRGALGIFQSSGMDGTLNIVLTPNKTGTATQVEFVYNLSGYVWGGYQSLPKTADGVLGLQLFRLKQLIETGSADTPRPAEKKQ
jgi:uncharacterized protein YndB with AHSA1/START domain